MSKKSTNAIVSKVKDTFRVMTGQDLTERKPKKTSTKSTPKKQDDGYKSKVTEQARLDANDYANQKDQLSKDLRAALRGGQLSEDLKKTLQVLVDNDEFRAMIGCQNGVLPSPDQYEVVYNFVDSEGKDANIQADALFASGVTLDGLSKFQITTEYYRRRLLDGAKLDDNPTEEEIKEVNRRIRRKILDDREKAKAKNDAKAS